MRHMTKNDLIILGILMVIIVGAVAFFFVPQGRKLDQLQCQLARKQQILSSESREASVVPKMLRRVEAMKSRYAGWDRKMPGRKELGQFLGEISGNLASEKLSDQVIEPGNPTRGQLFHTLPIIMRFRGSYPSLANFLERIDKMQRLTRVQKLKIKADTGHKDLNIELLMNIYFTES